MILTYCYRWSRHSKRVTEIWDEDRARQAYEKREIYTVLVGDPERPHSFIESNMDYIGVEFLDSHLREYLSYQFTEKERGKLFLQVMVTRKFIDYLDEVREGTTYIIDVDGKVRITHERFVSGYKKAQHESRVDPTPYWVPYPEFGKYVDLMQERPVPCVKVEALE